VAAGSRRWRALRRVAGASTRPGPADPRATPPRDGSGAAAPARQQRRTAGIL